MTGPLIVIVADVDLTPLGEAAAGVVPSAAGVGGVGGFGEVFDV